MNEFEKITLKYKTAGLFSKAANTTFNKGRMTLKSKKDFAEGQRIILNVKVLDVDSAVEIVSEVIQKKVPENPEEGKTYGLRWLNFTPKKLARFLNGELVSASPAPAAPAGKPAPAASAPPPPPAPSPPAPPPAPVKTAKTVKPPPPKPEPEPPPAPEQPAEAPPPAPDQEEPFDLLSALKEDEDTTPPEPEPALALEPEPEPVDSPPPSAPAPPAEVETPPEPSEFSPEPEAASGPPALEPEAETFGDLQGPPPEPEPISPEEPAEPAEERGADDLAEPLAPLELDDESPEAGEDGAADEQPALDPDEILEPEPEELESAALESAEPLSASGPVADEPSGEGPAPAELEASAASEIDEGPAPLVASAAAAGRRFTDEELVSLGGFLMKFVKLVSQAGRAGGREGEFPLKGLHDEFQSLMSGRAEIMIYVRSMGAVREFMLSGGGIDPVNLKNALPADQFSELAVKLVDLFVDKNIAGLQFRRFLNEEALERLVVRLGEYDPFNQSPEELGGGLIGDGVFHATVVHESDRVVDAARLDFRVDMTLSRLRGELKRLGFLAEAMGEDPAAVWTLRVEDALKALPGGELRAELLLHGDLVVAGQEEVSAAELIQEIVMSTPEEMLGEAGKLLSARYESTFKKLEAGAKEGRLKEELEKIRRVLRQVTARLLVELPEVAAQIMGDLYRRGVFTLEELPPELRERMMLDQYINFYLQDPEQRLSDFGSLKTAKDYKNAANRYVAMAVELVRSGQTPEGDRIFRALLANMREESPQFPNRPVLTREALTGLAKPHHLRVLTQSLGRAEKERREAIAGMIFAAGPAAAGALIEGLKKEEDRSARRMICEILGRFGEPVVEEILKGLRDPAAPWYLIRNLVMIMGDLKSLALREDLDVLLSHEHPRVREETLGYAARSLEGEAEPVLARGLTDPSALVRRRAGRALARHPELSDETARATSKMVGIRPAQASVEEEQAVASAAELASRFGGRKLPGGKTMEDALIEVLDSEAPKGLLGRLTGSKSMRTPKMKVSLIDALGEVGSSKSKKVLSALSKDKDAEVKEGAQRALQAISGRE